MISYEFHYEVACESAKDAGYHWVEGQSEARAKEALDQWLEENYPGEYGWQLLETHVTRTRED